MPKQGDFDWPDAAVTQLRQLWAEGHSTAEIGRRMGLSKNSVIGKADRLGLNRPNPLLRDPHRNDTIFRLYAAGLSNAEIGRLSGVGAHVVWHRIRWAADHGQLPERTSMRVTLPPLPSLAECQP